MTALPFEPEALVAEACEATGLDDLGEPTWQEGLERLVDGWNTTARLHDVGEVVAQQLAVQELTNRLGLVEWRRTHPEVAEVAIERPIVICGQPRTGTTILFDLLAQDPAHRAALSWEVERPVPAPQTASYRTDARIAEVQATLAMADILIPGFTAFHELGAELAQECVRITSGDFRSMLYSVQFEVPAYNRWLLHEADLAPAYRWHRRFLQHLGSEHRSDRWLLKSPAHLWHLDALLGEYPDAVLVQTHRDPVRIIASISALATHLRGIATDEATVAGAAAQYADDVLLGLERSLDARDRGLVGPGQVVDVRFADFVADPMATVGALYDQLGLDLTAETEAAMRAFLVAHPGDVAGGAKRYSFADTGLVEAELRERARPYQERYGVPSEAVA